jgi:hypothetical protein
MHRGQVIWGVVLLMLGGLMLADAMGLKLPGGVTPMELFWPSLLIFAGLWVLLGVFLRGGVEVEQVSVDLQGACEAAIRLDHGAGELKVHGGAGSGVLARGSFAGGLDQKSSKIGDRLEVRMRPRKDVLDFPFFGPHSQLDWDVALGGEIPLALTFNTGANKSELDLHELQITQIKLETGASDTRVTLPARGRFTADLDLGAASLTVILPEGLAARIRASVGVADLKINETRFPRTGNLFQSPDYETALHAVDMTIDAGAASIRIP